jgi:hypothetical protein
VDRFTILQGDDAQVRRHPERIELLNVGLMTDTAGVLFHEGGLRIPADLLAPLAFEARSFYLEDHVLKIPRRLHARMALLCTTTRNGGSMVAACQLHASLDGVCKVEQLLVNSVALIDVLRW